MKKVILDTSFIISCVKQKIDFFEEISLMGMKILIPKEVIEEIEKLNNSDSKLSLKILGKDRFEKISIGKGHVDNRIVKFARENEGIIVATLDKEIKKRVKNNKLIIRGRKKLEVV